KLHFAATGMTAAELIAGRADEQRPNMGLTSWKGDVVRRGDVTVAKNYLNQTEIDELNRIVTMWLDFAEDQARRRKQVFLRDWQTRLDEFLRFNERDVLAGKGHVSKADADARAQAEYERFEERRRALLEAEAERAQQRALEDAAKALPAPPKKPARKRKGRKP
ncbi:MAG: virulence RhuM family protein, partial [Planctomycetes bacterium]|nr:virulence RhuM family protein [Planctomycetota bacterium]